MELKFREAFARLRALWLFKSHLYGIEIESPQSPRVPRIGLNRTFMELKSVPSTKVNLSPGCLNRTFMELKFRYCRQVGCRLRFKSHLYGIEIVVWCACMVSLARLNRTFMELKSWCGMPAWSVLHPFKSHLYGIEIRLKTTFHETLSSLNRTFMELKSDTQQYIYCSMWSRLNRTFMELK